METEPSTQSEEQRGTLLIVDDDAPLRNRLGRAMTQRGFSVVLAASVEEGIACAKESPPDYAVIDMRLEDGNGMTVIDYLSDLDADTKIVMLTGYGNIASAVMAVKKGVIDFLPKPADADQIMDALLAKGDRPIAPAPQDPMSADRVRWEHIQRVFEQCERNVSETARRLKMHRRTLQRILHKHAPRD
ncbi:MAG: ActR/PrrA/RegA family redox response regulator transcription factor [Alphaproteobacteria bacterium]